METEGKGVSNLLSKKEAKQRTEVVKELIHNGYVSSTLKAI